MMERRVNKKVSRNAARDWADRALEAGKNGKKCLEKIGDKEGAAKFDKLHEAAKEVDKHLADRELPSRQECKDKGECGC